MEPARALFLGVAFATHAALGYALVDAFTDADPRLGALVALAPDADFLFPGTWSWPFVHRGLTHAPVVAVAAVAGAYAVRRQRTDAAAVALALGSHLCVDALSPAGIPLAFPLEAAPNPGLPVHGPLATVVLWTIVVSLLRVGDPGLLDGIRRRV